MEACNEGKFIEKTSLPSNNIQILFIFCENWNMKSFAS